MTDYTYEVTDTGKYYYENNVRIFPEQFWYIIKKLEHKIDELDFELKECKERKLYSRRELEKENEQLKSKHYWYKQYKELLNENEQLKSVVKEVIELLSEEVDLFSDKATEHDINAYIELKELDNKDAYYMATATKKAIKLLKEIIDDC